jgi:hypothetical protein
MQDSVTNAYKKDKIKEDENKEEKSRFKSKGGA